MTNLHDSALEEGVGLAEPLQGISVTSMQEGREVQALGVEQRDHPSTFTSHLEIPLCPEHLCWAAVPLAGRNQNRQQAQELQLPAEKYPAGRMP